MKVTLTAFLGSVLLLGFPSTDAHARDQASMTALMGQLTPAYVQSIAGRDDELKKLLLMTFEADWSKAKECLLFAQWPPSASVKAPPHEAGLLLMAELVRMRSVVCNGIAKDTQRGILGQLQQQKLSNDNPISQAGLLSAFQAEIMTGSPEQHFNPLTPTGAEKLTSDIDVASNGLNTELGVRLFNEKFRESLKIAWDPATVFDYNIYAADWIFPLDYIEVKSGSVTRLTPQPEHVLVRDAGAKSAEATKLQAEDLKLQAERTVILEKAAVLHLRRSCTEAEWSDYKRQCALAGTPAREIALLQSVDLQFKSFNAEIAAKIAQLRPTISTPQGSLWPDSYYEDALETRARNDIYTTRLLRVKALRLGYKLLKDQPTKSDSDWQKMSLLAKQLTEALTEAIFFANEVYATEGATLHATQALQKVAKEKANGITLEVVLTPPQYEQAFHENVGDALHSLNHYKNAPAYATYRAGKYIERMLLAGEVLAGTNPAFVRGHRNYSALKALADEAAQVKVGKDGDDPVAITKLFTSYNTPAKQTLLRAMILSFAADLSGKRLQK